MFTGIVEELGQIQEISSNSSSMRFTISTTLITNDLKIGDSISVNGVCLTVINHAENSFYLDIVNETLEKSNLGDLKKGDNVNLDVELIMPIAMEKELRFAIREGGHTVGAGVVTEITE